MLKPAVLATLLAMLAATGCTVDSNEPDPAASVDAGAATSDAADLLPYMATCVQNEDCETELCFQFNQGGPRCTHSCSVDTDCAAPSQGCNNKGVCKRPNGDGDNGVDAGI